MTLTDVISQFDRFRPNTFEFPLKKDWLIKIETGIREFVKEHIGGNTDMNFASEENPTLFLGWQDKDIYIYYLASMADITNGEYSLYNISSTYFNSIFNEWKRKYRSDHMPLRTTIIKM